MKIDRKTSVRSARVKGERPDLVQFLIFPRSHFPSHKLLLIFVLLYLFFPCSCPTIITDVEFLEYTRDGLYTSPPFDNRESRGVTFASAKFCVAFSFLSLAGTFCSATRHTNVEFGVNWRLDSSTLPRSLTSSPTVTKATGRAAAVDVEDNGGDAKSRTWSNSA